MLIQWLIGSEIKGLEVVPILLLANICLGIYYNLSIWYKLTDKTGFGAYISIFGAIITVVLNIWWIPLIGYMGSAWATFICYASMMVISFFYGQKHYHINYNIVRILGYAALSIGLYFISVYVKPANTILLYSFNTLLLLVFTAVVIYIERPSLLIKQKHK